MAYVFTPTRITSEAPAGARSYRVRGCELNLQRYSPSTRTAPINDICPQGMSGVCSQLQLTAAIVVGFFPEASGSPGSFGYPVRRGRSLSALRLTSSGKSLHSSCTLARTGPSLIALVTASASSPYSRLVLDKGLLAPWRSTASFRQELQEYLKRPGELVLCEHKFASCRD